MCLRPNQTLLFLHRVLEAQPNSIVSAPCAWGPTKLHCFCIVCLRPNQTIVSATCTWGPTKLYCFCTVLEAQPNPTVSALCAWGPTKPYCFCIVCLRPNQTLLFLHHVLEAQPLYCFCIMCLRPNQTLLFLHHVLAAQPTNQPTKGSAVSSRPRLFSHKLLTQPPCGAVLTCGLKTLIQHSNNCNLPHSIATHISWDKIKRTHTITYFEGFLWIRQVFHSVTGL